MKKNTIDHVTKLLAGTAVVVVSSLMSVAPASADTADAAALPARTEQVAPVSFSVCEGTCSRVAVATTLQEVTEQVAPVDFSVCEGTCSRVSVAATSQATIDMVGDEAKHHD